MTGCSISAPGFPAGFVEQVCGLCQTEAVKPAPEGAGQNTLLLVKGGADDFADALPDTARGLVEVSDGESAEDIAGAVDAGIPGAGWFASVKTATALEIETASILVAKAAKALDLEAVFDDARLEDISTAVRELMMNASVHGNLELPSPDSSAKSVMEHHRSVSERMQNPTYSERRVRFEVTCDETTAAFSVIDEGLGYVPEAKPEEAHYSGRGMKIVQDLSDDLSLAEGGRRTTVTFNKSTKEAEPVASVPGSTAPQPHRDVLSLVGDEVHKCSILVVDDEEMLVQMTQFQLEDAGFTRLDQAFDGEEAWRKIKEKAPDLVILDHSMPGLTGLELLERVRADDRLCELPVVLVSAHEDREFRADAYRTGATNVLTKPVDPDLLYHRVRQLLTSLLLLRKLRAFHHRVEQELTQAQRMQEALMPTEATLDTLAEKHGVTLAGRFQMSSELGGDWWGIRDFDGDKFALYTVDFSGHGVGPAINTFRLHTLMRDLQSTSESPGQYLEILNSELKAILRPGQYATMLYGIFDVPSRKFTYAATGCPAPIFGGRNGRDLTAGETAGVPLGLARNSKYEDHVIEIPEDGFLMLYSDVLLEGEGTDGLMLGDDGLMNLIQSTLAARTGAEPERELDQIIETFLARSALPLDDDLTAVWLGV